MKGDFSRNTFNPRLHLSRVLMQQGRVLVDADWNEQTSILLHYLRSVITDFAGPVVPIGDAFMIQPAQNPDGSVDPNDFAITPGHLYIDGILCENEGDDGATYASQVHYPIHETTPFTGTALVYLDVWERHVTHIQMPEIREVALGGPDTSSRAHVVWQVKLQQVDQGITCDRVRENWDELIAGWQPSNRGRLRACAARQSDVDDDACITPPHHRYRGQSNRLYRVEVHTGGHAGVATFKWSRENGSVALPLLELPGTAALVETLGVDESHSVSVGDWIEIIDDVAELLGRPGVLAEVASVDPIDRLLQLDPAGDTLPEFDELTTRPLLRRWDHRHGVEGGGKGQPNGALVIEEGRPIGLEAGIEIEFVPAANGEPHVYRNGDYWLIPARTVTGDVEWPRNDTGAVALEPMGVDHHYAPLAIIAPGAAPMDCLINARHWLDT